MVSGTDFDVVVNPNTCDRSASCQFCHNCPSVRGCCRRTELTLNSFEYILTSKTPNVEDTLRARISAMPIAPSPKCPVLGNLSTEQSKANFSIHSASLVQGPQSDIQGMEFCVSFLSKYAEPMGQVWVSGKAMNSMITHAYQKKKYVFDETIVEKPGWRSRNNSMLTYEKSDDDDTPLTELKVKAAV